MGENSKIEWTKHTFNPWVGCQKVGPGCDNCYAEAMMATRYGRVEWGPHGSRSRTSPANWRKPLAWDRAAAEAGERHRVFCASLADVFDNHGSITSGWRGDLWHLIARTPNLDWMLLTKRPGNIAKMLPETYGAPPWGDGWPNVWLGCTIVNRDEMLRDAPKLALIPARVRFWSAEPLLGDLGEIPNSLLPDLVIAGGESGPGARPVHPDWLRSLRNQCAAAGTAFHFKQWGEWAPGEVAGPNARTINAASWFGDRWMFEQTPPARHDDHIDDEPDLFRVGKARAGRALDGRSWDQMPGERE